MKNKVLTMRLMLFLLLLLLVLLPMAGAAGAQEPSTSSTYHGARELAAVATLNSMPCGGGETVLLIQDNVPWFVGEGQDSLGANVTELKAQGKSFCIISSETNKIVGGIGVSGRMASEDEEIARAGLDALKL